MYRYVGIWILPWPPHVYVHNSTPRVRTRTRKAVLWEIYVQGPPSSAIRVALPPPWTAPAPIPQAPCSPCPPSGQLLTDRGITPVFSRERVRTRSLLLGSSTWFESIMTSLSDEFPPAMRERPKWMKLLFRRVLSTRTVIAKEWSSLAASRLFSLGGAMFAGAP